MMQCQHCVVSAPLAESLIYSRLNQCLRLPEPFQYSSPQEHASPPSPPPSSPKFSPSQCVFVLLSCNSPHSLSSRPLRRARLRIHLPTRLRSGRVSLHPSSFANAIIYPSSFSYHCASHVSHTCLLQRHRSPPSVPPYKYRHTNLPHSYLLSPDLHSIALPLSQTSRTPSSSASSVPPSPHLSIMVTRLLHPLLLAALLALSVGLPHTMRSPNGHHIPTALLQPHVAGASPPELVDHIGDYLHLPSARLHIPSLAPMKLAPHLLHPRLTIHVNGAPTARPQVSVRKGPRHVFVFSHRDGRKVLAAAWGPGLQLRQIHTARFPRVLVNVARENADQAFDLSDDAVVPSSPSPSPDDMSSSAESADPVSRAVNPDVLSSLSTRQASCGPGDPLRNLEMAVSFDNEFCARHGDDQLTALAAIQGLVIASSPPFEQQTCVRLALVHIDAHCKDRKDPFRKPAEMENCPVNSKTCSRGRIILNMVRDKYTSSPRMEVRRDLAVFVSGYGEGTGTSGMAYISAACRGDVGVAWVEQESPIIFAHEVGHTLGANHGGEGIMRGTVMFSDPLEFSSRSVSEISRFTGSATCMTSDGPKCDETCPGACVRGMCLATASGKLPAGVVRCVSAQGAARCVENRDLGGREYFFVKDCPSGFEFASPLAGSTEPAFCCEQTSTTLTAQGISQNVGVSSLRFTFGDGRRETFEGYVSDQSKVQSLTLMNTRLLPDCNLSGASTPNSGTPPTPRKESPTPSPAMPSSKPSQAPPSMSASPAAPSLAPSPAAPSKSPKPAPPSLAPSPIAPSPVAPSPTSSAAVPTATSSPMAPSQKPQSSPIPSMKPSPVASSPEPRSLVPRSGTYRSCADTFSHERGPVCQTVPAGTITRPGVPSISVALTQQSGLFKVELRTEGTLRAVGASLRVARAALKEEIRTMNVRLNAVRMVVRMNNVKTTGDMDICCGRRLFVAVVANVCGADGCEDVYEWFGVVMKCANPCAGKVGGTPRGMSSLRKCPVCLN